MEVSSRFLIEGSRWEGALLAFHRRGSPQDHEFRRAVTDGGWHVSALFEPDPRKLKDFGVIAIDRRELCLLILGTGQPTSAISSCSDLQSTALVARRLRDGGIKVRFLLSDERRDRQPWTIDVRVSGGELSQSVTVSASTDPRGRLWTTAVTRGVDEPRIFVTATNERGRRCTLGINPDQLGAEALPSRAELLRAVRDLGEIPYRGRWTWTTTGAEQTRLGGGRVAGQSLDAGNILLPGTPKGGRNGNSKGADARARTDSGLGVVLLLQLARLRPQTAASCGGTPRVSSTRPRTSDGHSLRRVR